MAVKQDMKLFFSLPNNGFTLLNAELKDKQWYIKGQSTQQRLKHNKK
jgi:hypothetical protein